MPTTSAFAYYWACTLRTARRNLFLSRNFRVLRPATHSVLVFGVNRRAVRAAKSISVVVHPALKGVLCPILFRVHEFLDIIEFVYIIRQYYLDIS